MQATIWHRNWLDHGSLGIAILDDLLSAFVSAEELLMYLLEMREHKGLERILLICEKVRLLPMMKVKCEEYGCVFIRPVDAEAGLAISVFLPAARAGLNSDTTVFVSKTEQRLLRLVRLDEEIRLIPVPMLFPDPLPADLVDEWERRTYFELTASPWQPELLLVSEEQEELAGIVAIPADDGHRGDCEVLLVDGPEELVDWLAQAAALRLAVMRRQQVRVQPTFTPPSRIALLAELFQEQVLRERSRGLIVDRA